MDDRPNLTLLLETWAHKLELDGTRVTGVRVRTKDGEDVLVRARATRSCSAPAPSTPRGC